MDRFPRFFALSVVLVASSATPAQQITIESLPYTARMMTDRAAEEVADDLALSDLQRSLWMEMMQWYRDRFREADADRREADSNWILQSWLELVPELDEAVDVSDRPEEEQAEIAELRRQ